jgi:hypothetical protein
VFISVAHVLSLLVAQQMLSAGEGIFPTVHSNLNVAWSRFTPTKLHTINRAVLFWFIAPLVASLPLHDVLLTVLWFPLVVSHQLPLAGFVHTLFSLPSFLHWQWGE